MPRLNSILCLLVCAALVVSGVALQGWSQVAPGKPVKIALQQYKLKNGLRVTLSEDHSAPTYSIDVAYDVGSRNEREGRTGFAHLFEHMMYQGSENVGKGEQMLLVLNNGGNMNGTTNEDRTTYFETLPANQLDLGLFLEADRMRSLAVNQANLDNQRNAVQEERRQGIDNQPYGKTFEAIDELAYTNFGYKHSTIGSMADLNAASLEDVTSFFKMYYAPNNAVLTLVGDFDSKIALEKIRKYFEAIAAQPAPPPVDMTEPPQTAERRKTLEDNFAQLPRLDIVWHIPPANTPDWYALQVLGNVMMSGQSSPVYQKLVKEKEVAAFQPGGGPQMRRGPSIFLFDAVIRPGKAPEEAEKLFYEILEHYTNTPVTPEELAKVRTMTRRSQIQSMQSTLSRAVSLGDYAVYFGDPELIWKRVERYDSVTPADIQRVAKQYLIETNRSVIITLPKPKAAPAAKSGL